MSRVYALSDELFKYRKLEFQKSANNDISPFGSSDYIVVVDDLLNPLNGFKGPSPVQKNWSRDALRRFAIQTCLTGLTGHQENTELARKFNSNHG